MKVSWKEFKEFYDDPVFWDTGIYHDDTDIEVDDPHFGEILDFVPDECTPDTVVKFTGGVVYNKEDHPIASFIGYFKRWRKKKYPKDQIVTVRIPLDKIDDLKEWLKNNRGSIL